MPKKSEVIAHWSKMSSRLYPVTADQEIFLEQCNTELTKATDYVLNEEHNGRIPEYYVRRINELIQIKSLPVRIIIILKKHLEYCKQENIKIDLSIKRSLYRDDDINNLVYKIRACLQFIPTAYVPRLVRGIQMIPINGKYLHIDHAIGVYGLN